MSDSTPRIYLTLRCNLACSFCSNGKRLAKYREQTAAEWREWFREHTYFRDFIFTGGEPTLHHEFYKIVDIATGIGAVTVYSNFEQPLDFSRLVDGGRLSFRASCHSQTAEDAMEWVARVRDTHERGYRMHCTTVLAPQEVLDVLRPYGITVDAPQHKPQPLPAPVYCHLPRYLIAPDGNRYQCVGKLVHGEFDGVIQCDWTDEYECHTPDHCAACDSLSAQRRVE